MREPGLEVISACLRWVARTSWPASLVAKAAEAQGRTAGDRVLRRLRETTFILGRPADTLASAAEAVRGVPELDYERLTRDVGSAEVLAAVRRDRAEARRPYPEVLRIDGPGPHNGRAKPVDNGHRFALPTLVFKGPAGRAVVPGWRGLAEYVAAADRAAPGSTLSASLADAADALVRHRSLTGAELRLLTGSATPPPGAVRVDSGNGPVWLHSEEAAVHPACQSGSDDAGPAERLNG